MSVSSVGSGSLDPGFYTYPNSTVPGLSDLSVASTPSTSSSTPSSTSGTSTATSATSAENPYLADYDSFEAYDSSELIQVSLGSQSSATSNVDSVLAQAAALQNEQTTAQNAALAADANADIQGTASSNASSSSTSSANDPLNIPSYESIVAQSDTDAYNALNNALGIGSSGTSNALSGAGSSSTTSNSALDSLLGFPSSTGAASPALGGTVDTTA
jgi:hypothetical protein